MDFYEILGIATDADDAEIRRAYQKRARSLHPHLNPGDPVAAQRFEQVAEAFSVLRDPQRRAAYDRGESAAPVRAAVEGSFEGFDFSAEVRVERVGFREIFDGALRTSARRGRDGGVRGEDVERRTTLTFEEAFRGAERRLQVERYEACAACQGGGEIGMAPAVCERCRGAGQVRGSRGHMLFARRCTACDGTGQLTRHPCSHCAGEGRVPGNEWFDLRIPPGAAGARTVRLAACGNAGPRGGPPGDLVLHVDVEPHPVFRREGDDLSCNVAVSIVQAALGGHVEVATPDGAMVVELPAGTQHGHRFRLRKRGLPRPDGIRTDLFVEVRVSVPTVTDDEGRALLRAFAERHPQTPEELQSALVAAEK
jgi:molecular chaperone DnaJ